jgi:hypothetical protein
MIRSTTEYFVLKSNKKKIERMTNPNKNGKTSPNGETNHHLTGLTYGARQASKYIMARRIFIAMSNFLVKVRNLLAIHAIYKFKQVMEAVSRQSAVISR